MTKQEDNKAVVVRWFTDFWGETCDLSVVDDIAAPDMLLKYSLHEPRRGRDDIKAFMTDFRAAFPDLNFWAPPTSSPRGIMSSASGRVAAPTPVPRSRISSPATCPATRAKRCTSPVSPSSSSRMARSSRRTVSMTGSPP